MERKKAESPERLGSVKAAISLFGGRINGGKLDKYNSHRLQPEDLTTRTRELHQANFDIIKLRERRATAETEKARAESELYFARGAAKELVRRIEESNARAKTQTLEIQSLKMPRRHDASEYLEAMQELEKLRQEVSKLKLEVASAVETKSKAKKEIESYSTKSRSLENSVEKLKKEIDCVNEEHVLVEIARMEAERELREIESKRAAEFSNYCKEIEVAKSRIKELRKEVRRAKELEKKLAVTTSDADVLENELQLMRAVEKNFEKRGLVNDDSKNEEDDDNAMLQSAEDELKVAKKELAALKDEGFQFMMSMDAVREELINLYREKETMKEMEKKTDSTIQQLNTKLLKAKSKLESSTMADSRAKAIIENLSSALQQLQTDAEAARKERDLIDEEAKAIRLEIKKSESSVISNEERLLTAMDELEAAKASEAAALKKLKTVAESTMRTRARQYLHNSNITISKGEYDYLRRQAAAAQDVANKKVAAAQAWVEALKAEEKEILMMTELKERALKELCFEDEKELRHKESLVAKKVMEEELHDCRIREDQDETMNSQIAKARPKKPLRENSIAASQRRAKMRRSSVSQGSERNSRSLSFTIRKRKKVVPTFVMFLRRKRTGKQK